MPISWEIFHRELLVAGRGRVRSYALPWTLFACALAMWVSIDVFDADASLAPTRHQFAAGLLSFFAIFAQWGSLAAVCQSAATYSVATERESGSLDLLLLTVRSPARVIWPKYFALLIQTMCYVVAFAPFYTIARIFHLEYAGYAQYHFVFLANVAVAAPAITIAVSAWSRNPPLAGGFAFVFIALYVVLTMVGIALIRNGLPPTMFVEDFVTPVRTIGESGLLLLWTAVSVACAMEIARSGVRQQFIAADSKTQAAAIRDDARERSVVELVRIAAWGRPTWKRNVLQFFAGALLGVIPILGWMIVPCALASHVTQGIARIRQSGLWNELVVMPESDVDLAKAMRSASIRSSWPLVIGGILSASLSMLAISIETLLYAPALAAFIMVGIPMGFRGTTLIGTPKEQEQDAVGSTMGRCIIHGAFMPTLVIYVLVGPLGIPFERAQFIWVPLATAYCFFAAFRAGRRAWNLFLDRYRLIAPEEHV